MRDQALDPTQSFIVQAPAGSGKTHLLVQRFLTLLKQVESPEQILAITFTRKAADEMRERILLELGNTPNPQRLRVMTIDSLCAWLVQQAPFIMHLGDQTAVSDDPQWLYEKAAMQLLHSLEHQETWSQDLAHVLAYLNNDVERTKNLFIRMLANRDQWLPYIINIDDVSFLEKALQQLILDHLEYCYQLMSGSISVPAPELICYDEWKALANACLTKVGEWRKKIPEEYQRIVGEQYKNALNEILHLPPVNYSKEQKQLLRALIHLLPILVSYLQVVFSESKKVDYSEVALRALQALGEGDEPSQFALSLDYQIQHILVDEFQDTSVTQWRLLEKLVAGWQRDDGRTLFLVGDPMQSIYRFRKAEVGLFLQAQQRGIGDVTLTPLQLTSNFRAQAKLVDWLNTTFSQVFPEKEDIARGAISYASTCHSRGSEAQQAVCYHQFQNPAAEEKIIINIIQQNPTQHIAILVRSRQHAASLFGALKNAHIDFHAPEMFFLCDDTGVQDLLSLTKALYQPFDRAAWLAILRAPWCGLSLHDLHVLCAHDHESCLWDLLLKADKEKLSPESKIRVSYFIDVMQIAMNERFRKNWRDLIQQTWHALKGPWCLQQEVQLDYAKLFFQLLNEFTTIEQLEARLEKMPLPMSQTSALVEIMTIHKAKGLEFDVVVLPGLYRQIRHDDAPLLLWQERPQAHATIDLLIAPISTNKKMPDEIYQYLKREEKIKSDYEAQRLLYVAATRAKNQLHLLWPEAMQKPHAQSLLADLWPGIEKNQQAFLVAHETAATNNIAVPVNLSLLQRLPLSVFANKFMIEKSAAVATVKADSKNAEIIVGIFVHRLLCQMAKIGLENWPTPKPLQWRYALLQLGLLEEELDNAVVDVERCMQIILQDERAHWILSREHESAHSEYAIANVIMDRTFIDAQKRRWIIDYKITREVEREKYAAQLINYANILQAKEQHPIYLGLYFPLTGDWIEWPHQNN